MSAGLQPFRWRERRHLLRTSQRLEFVDGGDLFLSTNDSYGHDRRVRFQRQTHETEAELHALHGRDREQRPPQPTGQPLRSAGEAAQARGQAQATDLEVVSGGAVGGD